MSLISLTVWKESRLSAGDGPSSFYENKAMGLLSYTSNSNMFDGFNTQCNCESMAPSLLIHPLPYHSPLPLRCRQLVTLIHLLVQSPTRSVQTGVVSDPFGMGSVLLTLCLWLSWSWVWCHVSWYGKWTQTHHDCQTSLPVVVAQRGCHYNSSLTVQQCNFVVLQEYSPLACR